MALLAHELERALADADLGKECHRRIRAQQQLDLVVERDGERIAQDGRPVLARQRRRGGETHGGAVDPRRCPRDADRVARRILDRRRIEHVDGGETPGAACDHANADTLVVEQLHGCDDTVLDGELLHRAIDDAAVGIRGARGGRRIERSLADLAHDGRV